MSGCADGIIRLWKLPIPQIAVPGVVNSVVFSPDGRLLTTCSETLQLWNATTLASLSAGFGPSGLTAEAAAFDPAAPLLVAAFSDGTLRLFDIADPAHPIPVGQAAKASASGYVESVAFNKTGTVIATGDDDATVRLWQVAKSAQLTAGRVLTGFAANVFDVTFSSDGTTLAAASIDRSVRLWHVPDAENAQLLGSPIGFSAYAYSVAFSPNGTTLAVGIANGTVHLLNMANAAHPTSEGPALTGPSGYVYALAFSPDGSMLAGAVTDDNLWLWDVTNARSPTALATLTGTTHSLFTVAFSPSGSTLAASGADSVVRFWQPDAIQARDSQCAGIGEPLTPADWARYAPGLPFTAPCA
jgi:WD40 repeat protein